MAQVLLPILAEGVSKATVTYWHKAPGDTVALGEDLVELATDKATFNMPSPLSGTVKTILADEGSDVEVGQTIAVIE